MRNGCISHPLAVCYLAVVGTIYCPHRLFFPLLHLLLGDLATQTSQPYNNTLVLVRTFIYQSTATKLPDLIM